MTVDELIKRLEKVPDGSAIVCLPDYSTGERDGEHAVTLVTVKPEYRDKWKHWHPAIVVLE